MGETWGDGSGLFPFCFGDLDRFESDLVFWISFFILLNVLIEIFVLSDNGRSSPTEFLIKFVRLPLPLPIPRIEGLFSLK